ncbi:hypothetical protein COJ77_18995 [Bacillus cereus]|nr:hypothetical protein COJ77_18995 [Bacillus cereus]
MKNNPLQIICGITGVSSSSFYKRMHDLKQINIEAFHIGIPPHRHQVKKHILPQNDKGELQCYKKHNISI